MDSWLRPGAIAEYIADQGYLAVVTNSGGGTAVAPPGGFDPVLGTNPIAYGIPTTDGSLVVDMATAKLAWAALASQISTARRFHQTRSTTTGGLLRETANRHIQSSHSENIKALHSACS